MSSEPTSCSRRPATRASATCRSRPTRSTARSSEGSFSELSPLDPSSPYSASKAGGDLLVSAFHHTYGADALIIRASNNYGPHQHPEKLIPLCILNALAGDPLPVYGDGMQVRNWLFVEDFALRDRHRARAGRGRGRSTTSVVPTRSRTSRSSSGSSSSRGRDESLISYVDDRPRPRPPLLARLGRSTEALGWKAAVGFDEGIERTVDWYRDNEPWWGPIRSGEYREYYEKQYGRRLGG